jgi:transcriptional regulator with XRE-family HTH domain
MQGAGINIEERNREIGQILQEARERQRLTVSECANFIATSRRRYTAMERGEATIGAAELEALMDFLGLSPRAVWQAVADPTSRQVVVHPGESVQIVVGGAGG